MKHLEAQWTSYYEAVIPFGAPVVQVVESRRAFYAGAWALYSIIMNGLDAKSQDETPRDLELMATLDREMRDFNEDVRKGRA